MTGAVKLPPLTADLSHYIDPENPILINNTAVIAVKDCTIRCSGLILSLRSCAFKEMLLEDNEIILTEFDDVKDSVYDSLKLLYGGSVIITEDKAFAIYKFGYIYKIDSMQKLVLDWLVSNAQIYSFWNKFIAFQRYPSELSVKALLIVVNNFLTNYRFIFYNETLDFVENCEEMLDIKSIITFIFSDIDVKYLEPNLLFLQELMNNQNISDSMKECCAEAFLDCLHNKMDNYIGEYNFKSQKILDVFESIHQKVSKTDYLKKLSSIQLKLLSIMSSKSEIPTTSGIITQRTQLYINRNNVSSTKLDLGKTPVSVKNEIQGESSRTNEVFSFNNYVPFFDYSDSESEDGDNYSFCNSDNEDISTSHYDMISCDTIYEMISPSTSKQTIVDFCQYHRFPYYYLVEIGLGWIDSHRSCTEQTVCDILADNVAQLPIEYYTEIVKTSLINYGKQLDIDGIENNLNYMYYEWKLDKNRIRQLFIGDPIWFRMPCTVADCHNKSQQIVYFKYNIDLSPAFEFCGNDVYNDCHNHKDIIKHWIMIYQSNFSHESNCSSDDYFDYSECFSNNESGYVYSFITDCDNYGNSFHDVQQTITDFPNNYNVWLVCLYKHE